MILKISLDLDGVIFEWNDYYNSIFGQSKSDEEVTKNVRKLVRDKEFWLNQPLIRKPDFIPSSFCTARINSKSLIKEQLKKNGLGGIDVYQVHGYSLSKAPQIKRSGADVHVDDSLSVYKDLTSKGIPCLLLDTPYNQHFQTKARIYSLNYKEIEETYNRLFV